MNDLTIYNYTGTITDTQHEFITDEVLRVLGEVKEQDDGTVYGLYGMAAAITKIEERWKK